MITNEHAQVLDEHDQVIDGLYATGNITATVMGRTYLGAGGSIANTMIFGYVAARHAAARRCLSPAVAVFPPPPSPLPPRVPVSSPPKARRGLLCRSPAPLAEKSRVVDEIPWLEA